MNFCILSSLTVSCVHMRTFFGRHDVILVTMVKTSVVVRVSHNTPRLARNGFAKLSLVRYLPVELCTSRHWTKSFQCSPRDTATEKVMTKSARPPVPSKLLLTTTGVPHTSDFNFVDHFHIKHDLLILQRGPRRLVFSTMVS